MLRDVSPTRRCRSQARGAAGTARGTPRIPYSGDDRPDPRLDQIVTNLLPNAARHAPPGFAPPVRWITRGSCGRTHRSSWTDGFPHRAAGANVSRTPRGAATRGARRDDRETCASLVTAPEASFCPRSVDIDRCGEKVDNPPIIVDTTGRRERQIVDKGIARPFALDVRFVSTRGVC